MAARTQFNQLTSLGNLGAAILAQVPDEAKAFVEPLIPAIVNGIHTAFSIAVAATFVVGIVTALIAAVVVLIVMPAGKIGEREDAGFGRGVPVGEAKPATD